MISQLERAGRPWPLRLAGSAGRHREGGGRSGRRLQGGSPDPLAHGLRQDHRDVRCPRSAYERHSARLGVASTPRSSVDLSGFSGGRHIVFRVFGPKPVIYLVGNPVSVFLHIVEVAQYPGLYLLHVKIMTGKKKLSHSGRHNRFGVPSAVILSLVSQQGSVRVEQPLTQLFPGHDDLLFLHRSECF